MITETPSRERPRGDVITGSTVPPAPLMIQGPEAPEVTDSYPESPPPDRLVIDWTDPEEAVVQPGGARPSPAQHPGGREPPGSSGGQGVSSARRRLEWALTTAGTLRPDTTPTSPCSPDSTLEEHTRLSRQYAIAAGDDGGLATNSLGGSNAGKKPFFAEGCAKLPPTFQSCDTKIIHCPPMSCGASNVSQIGTWQNTTMASPHMTRSRVNTGFQHPGGSCMVQSTPGYYGYQGNLSLSETSPQQQQLLLGTARDVVFGDQCQTSLNPRHPQSPSRNPPYRDMGGNLPFTISNTVAAQSNSRLGEGAPLSYSHLAYPYGQLLPPHPTHIGVQVPPQYTNTTCRYAPPATNGMSNTLKGKNAKRRMKHPKNSREDSVSYYSRPHDTCRYILVPTKKAPAGGSKTQEEQSKPQEESRGGVQVQRKQPSPQMNAPCIQVGGWEGRQWLPHLPTPGSGRRHLSPPTYGGHPHSWSSGPTITINQSSSARRHLGPPPRKSPKALAAALEELRAVIPACYNPERLSKVNTLRLAASYIAILTNMAKAEGD